MAKIDLSDAYMRVWIRLEDVAKLAFVVPPLPGDTEPLIGFHLSLPMGYVESAPFFCIVTETIADLVNENGQRFTHPHPLEALAATPPAPDHECFVPPAEMLRVIHPAASCDYLLEYVDVYIDDFILLRQGNAYQGLLATRNLFHNIDRVV